MDILKNVKDLASKFSFSKKREDRPQYDPAVDEPLVSFTIPPHHEELERYWVDEPYSFISILLNKRDKTNVYYAIEPKLNRFEKTMLEEVLEILQDVLTLKGMPDIDKIKDADKYELLRENTENILFGYSELGPRSFEKIYYYVKRNFIEFGEIGPIMHDTHIEDIWCNGVGIPVYLCHTGYGNLNTNIVFPTDEQLDSFVMRIAQQSTRHLSKSTPILDTAMRDGSRINITYGHEISPKGSSFSIRLQKKVPLTPLDLIAWGTFSSDLMAYFWLCMESGKNILFCGGTATGKTSSLNAICMFIPLNIRIVTLEDTREIQLAHENWIPTVTRSGLAGQEISKVDLEDLLRASLRQRPEYLLVGEVRGRESQILFQAMNAGHATCSTFHAGTPGEVLNRFTNPPINVPPAMFTALDILCVQTNVYDKGVEKRRVDRVAEVIGVTTQVDIKEVFAWNPIEDNFIMETSHVLADIMRRRGWNNKNLDDELNRRVLFMETLIEKGIRDYNVLIRWIDAYHKDPEKVISVLTTETIPDVSHAIGSIEPEDATGPEGRAVPGGITVPDDTTVPDHTTVLDENTEPEKSMR